MFARWGRFVYHFRWATLIASTLLLGLSILGIFTGGTLKDNGGFCSVLPAGKSAQLLRRAIPPTAHAAKRREALCSPHFTRTRPPACRAPLQKGPLAPVAPHSH